CISSSVIGSPTSPSTLWTDNRYCVMVPPHGGRAPHALTPLRTRLAKLDTRTQEARQRRITSTSTIAAYLGLRWHETALEAQVRGDPPGPRQSAGVGFISWACDAQECEGPGGVAGVAAQRRGDVAVAVGAQDADGEVAQAGHGPCVLPVRTWEASSAKVVSRVWCSASNRCADC